MRRLHVSLVGILRAHVLFKISVVLQAQLNLNVDVYFLKLWTTSSGQFHKSFYHKLLFYGLLRNIFVSYLIFGESIPKYRGEKNKFAILNLFARHIIPN